MDLLTKEDIKKFGFTYEPDATKCKTLKLKLSVPKQEMIDESYKIEISNQIPYQFVHQVKETPNSCEGDPNWCWDSKVLVMGHTKINKL